MPTFSQDITDNRIIIAVSVARDGTQPKTRYRALFDTGAQVTAISPEVVRDLALLPVAPITITVASGQQIDSLEYRARLDIPIEYNPVPATEPQTFFYGADIPVVGLPYQPQDYDVVLGMDLIRLFHATIVLNKLVLSN